MTPFLSTTGTHLGSVMAPDVLRLLIQDERRKAMRADPREREQHFEQANKWSDMLGAYNLLRLGARLGG